MARALEVSRLARRRSSPNPWVGCVVVSAEGEVVGEGATEQPGGRHAEIVALDAAGGRGRGATVYVTLEPCSSFGRTPPCAERLLEAGVARVVVAMFDPDPSVYGGGVALLKERGVEVAVGLLGDAASEYLRAYATHRRSGRPFVVLKLAMTADGRIAAPDGSSRFITGLSARRDAHELRADSDAVLVGAGTVRADDPELTVRLVEGEVRQPLRVVLGRAPESARVQPALEVSGDVRGILDLLGERGVLQLLVEGGAGVAGAFHRLGLVDRYVFYLAPVIMGGSDALALFSGAGSPSLTAAWRGRIASVRCLGDDLRLDLEPFGPDSPSSGQQ